MKSYKTTLIKSLQDPWHKKVTAFLLDFTTMFFISNYIDNVKSIANKTSSVLCYVLLSCIHRDLWKLDSYIELPSDLLQTSVTFHTVPVSKSLTKYVYMAGMHTLLSANFTMLCFCI